MVAGPVDAAERSHAVVHVLSVGSRVTAGHSRTGARVSLMEGLEDPASDQPFMTPATRKALGLCGSSGLQELREVILTSGSNHQRQLSDSSDWMWRGGSGRHQGPTLVTGVSAPGYQCGFPDPDRRHHTTWIPTVCPEVSDTRLRIVIDPS
jgi:hypothetical protein